MQKPRAHISNFACALQFSLNECTSLDQLYSTLRVTSAIELVGTWL